MNEYVFKLTNWIVSYQLNDYNSITTQKEFTESLYLE